MAINNVVFFYRQASLKDWGHEYTWCKTVRMENYVLTSKNEQASKMLETIMKEQDSLKKESHKEKRSKISLTVLEVLG